MFKRLESSSAGTSVATDVALAALPFDRNGHITAIAQQFDTARRSCFYNRINNKRLVVLSDLPPRHGDSQ